MSKSRGRFLSELLNSTGFVKRSRSDLAGADGTIDLDSLPTIPNSQLEHSSVSIAGHTLSLGGSLTLNTADIGEHASYLYYTDARARSAISVTGAGSYNSTTGVITITGGVTSVNSQTGAVSLDTDDVSEGAANLYYTDARSRAAISVTGSGSYNSSTGVITITGGVSSVNSQTGAVSLDTDDVSEGATNLYYTDARVGSYLTANSYATQSYVSTAISNLVDTAPSTLDTLNELAAALGDDANFSTTVTNSIATKWTQDNTKISNWDTAYGWGNHASAGYLTGNQTITLSGDASGSGTTSIVVTVADDSHNHIISNVDGLQAALDGKLSTTGKAADADLLDGQNGSYYDQSQFTGASFYSSNSGTRHASLDSSTSNNIGYISGSNPSSHGDGSIYTSAYSSSWVSQIFSDYRSSNLWTRTRNNGTWQSWHQIWHSGNDGSGSGLDADLLDGLQLHTGRNNEVNKVVRTDGSGYIQAGWINTTSGNASTSTPDRFYGSYDGYVRYYDRAYTQMYLGNTYKYTTSRRQHTTDSNYWVGTMGWGTTNLNDVIEWGSGFWDTWSSPANQPSGTSHWLGLNALHYTNGTNTYGWQLTVGAGSPDLMYVRGQWGSSPTSWYKVWNSANDGSGSGLDADTCDGQHLGTGANVTFNQVTGTTALYSPRMYDSNDTNFSINPEGTTYYRYSGRLEHHTGHQVGSYNSVGANSYNSNPIYSIGSNYNPASTTLSNFYGIGYTNLNASFITSGNGWGLYVAADGDARIFLSGSNGAGYFNGDVTAYASDRRLKENITPLSNPIEKIKKIRGVEFDWKDEVEELGFIPSMKHETGVIAQEIQEVIPDAVKPAPFDENYLTVDKEKIVPLLIEAIKEQQKMIEELQKMLGVQK